MSVRLRLNLRFERPVFFAGYLPEAEKDRLELYLDEGKYRAIVYLSDRNTQLAFGSGLPTEPELLKQYMPLHCSGLTLEIDALMANSEILSALENGQYTEELRSFGQEIFQIALQVQNSIIEFFRNIKKQHWLEPIRVDPRNYQNFLNQCQAAWLNSQGIWQIFRAEADNMVHLAVSLFTEEMKVDEDGWKSLSLFMERRRKISMRDVLIANSLKYLSEGNGRLAVVESVIALESAIKQLLPKVIVRLPGAPEVDERDLDRLIEKAGLRTTVEVGFKMIMVSAGLAADDIELLSGAIETRNSIIHNSRRYVGLELAQRYVNTIHNVILSFERWVNSP